MSSGKPRKPPGLLGWHFVAEDRRLGYGDGRLVEAGKIYEQPDASREPKLCRYGMHASVRAIDALGYAPGPVVCRVELSGDIVTDNNKAVARQRRVLWVADASKPLRDFARRCALDVAHLWDMPAIVRQYLETGDESVRSAAWSAAAAAAWWSAAAAAAWWSAASTSVAAAAWWSAAAERDKQNTDLTAALMALAPKEWRGV